MATDFLISFDDLKAGSAAVKRLVQAFTRAGATVESSDIDPKTRRTSGVNYRQVLITFTDNQKVLLGVKTTGDIFEVRVNGAALAIKNQDNQIKAVGEIAKALDAGRAKFQAKMARTKVALPKGITTAAPKMEQRLQEAETTLDAEIAAAKARVAELRAELGEPVMDSAGELFAQPPETWPTSWLGFKVMDDAAVMDRAASALPSAHQLSASVDLMLSNGDGGEMPMRGRVVRASFRAGKVNYDVALPIALDATGGVRAHAVIPDVDSALVRPAAGALDSVKAYAGEIRQNAAVLDSTHEAAGETFDGGEWDTLVAMKQAAKVEDGDVPSKSSRDSLVERGFVTRGDGMNWLTDKGKEIVAAMDSDIPALDSASDAPLGGSAATHKQQIESAKSAGRVLKGIAHRNATWKEGDTMAGDTVWVWDAPLPKPWVDGQYPRIGNEAWTAGIGLFTFTKASPEEVAMLQADGRVPAVSATLDAVDVPLASFDRPEVVEAQAIAARLASGDTLDDADLSHACATLENALDIVETNYPINLAEGNIAQAELEENAAESFRAALKMLESKEPLAA